MNKLGSLASSYQLPGRCTLDAFGVGFVVGSVVDVTAISLLNIQDSGAAMVYFTGSSGEGWVFAANPIALCGSLPQDALQRIMKNVLATAIG